MSTQEPQHAPAPVRIVSSAIERHPAAAASRMSFSVTPLQMHTYTVWGSLPGGWMRFDRKCE